MIAIAVVIVPQLAIPSRDRLGPPSVVPIVEAAVFLGMLIITAKPGPVPRGARPIILTLFVVLAVANAAGAIRLVDVVLASRTINGAPIGPARLLVAGALVLSTNVITFGLLYWQLDGGGPYARLADPAPLPDFQFPQTAMPELAPSGWLPRFADFLYVSYTNLVAFSPTDTAPLTIRAKLLMTLQSLISLAVLVVVLSRVINLLPQ